MDRYKRFREAMQPKLETPDTEAASTEVQSWSPPRTSTKAAHSADKTFQPGSIPGTRMLRLVPPHTMSKFLKM
jgi:hypothetical protein